MSPESQRIAIAEACGWHNCDIKYDQPCGMRTWGSGLTILPDYLNDLNAMHEAEKGLTKEQQVDFSYELKEIVCPITGEDWCAIHATAAQRAEAFLKTLGLWVEEPVSEATVEGLR